MTLENYAMKILADNGCDCYTYGGEYADKLMDDLTESYPNGMKFPYIDVANAILSISRVHPIVRAPWKMVYDGGDFVDSSNHNSFEEAKSDAIETLFGWMHERSASWKFGDNGEAFPTDEQIEEWNDMIESCSVWAEKYNADKDEYEEYWFPPYDEEDKIGWTKIGGV